MSKLLIGLLALGFASVSFASQVEILQFSTFDNSQNQYQAEAYYHNICMTKAYELETAAMVKTGDSDIKIRMSRLEYHPAGVFYCFVTFFPTQKTDLKKEILSFEQKTVAVKKKKSRLKHLSFGQLLSIA